MKSGFAILIGRSNVGKSTLLNALVGTKLSIITEQAQTTRAVIHGVVNHPEGQVVFLDTPGILQSVGGSLSGRLLQKVRESLHGINVILYVVDPTRSLGTEERFTLSLIRTLTVPKFLVINKIDAERKPFLEDYRALSEEFAATFEISALEHRHLKPLLAAIMAALPVGEPFYPENQRTNLTKEQWVAEIIREKLLPTLHAEIPYAVHVVVDQIEDKPATAKQPHTFVIAARILTSQARYKKMIIGQGAHRLKHVGIVARKELAAALDSKIYLDLEVVVDPHWVNQL